MLIKERPVARAVGIADNGVFGNNWINFPGGDGMQQAFPNGAPVAVRCSRDRPVRRSFSEGGSYERVNVKVLITIAKSF